MTSGVRRRIRIDDQRQVESDCMRCQTALVIAGLNPDDDVQRGLAACPSAYSSLTAGRPGTRGEGWIYLQYEYGEDGKQYAGCELARFNLAWLLDGERTGDGRVPDWVSSPASQNGRR